MLLVRTEQPSVPQFVANGRQTAGLASESVTVNWHIVHGVAMSLAFTALSPPGRFLHPKRHSNRFSSPLGSAGRSADFGRSLRIGRLDEGIRSSCGEDFCVALVRPFQNCELIAMRYAAVGGSNLARVYGIDHCDPHACSGCIRTVPPFDIPEGAQKSRVPCSHLHGPNFIGSGVDRHGIVSSSRCSVI